MLHLKKRTNPISPRTLATNHPFPVPCSLAALDANGRKNRTRRTKTRTGHRSAGSSPNGSPPRLSRGSDRSCLFPLNECSSGSMEIEQRSLSRSQHLTILGYSRSPSSIYVTAYFINLVLCLWCCSCYLLHVYCGCRPIHNETIPSTGWISLQKHQRFWRINRRTHRQQPYVILTAYFFKAIQPYSLYAILQPATF